eukprot:11189057-Lingulodinium_polyedra.AAC.1
MPGVGCEVQPLTTAARRWTTPPSQAPATRGVCCGDLAPPPAAVWPTRSSVVFTPVGAPRCHRSAL